jgi:hypothetical protein
MGPMCIGRLGIGHPQGAFGVFSYYQLVMLFLNMVCLTVALTKKYFNEVRLASTPNTRGISRPIWQRVSTVSLKFHPGPPCQTHLCSVGGPPLKRPYGHFLGSPPKGGRHEAIFYPFGYPTPYGPAHTSVSRTVIGV